MYQVLAAYSPNCKRFVSAIFFAFLTAVTLSYTVKSQDIEEQVDVVAIFNQGQELHEKGDLARAIELYDKALKAMPDFPEAEFQRGMAFIGLGKLTEAETAYRRAIELRPDWTLAMTGLGTLLINRGKHFEAEPFLRKVLEIEPQNPPAMAAFSEIRLQAKAPTSELQELLNKLSNLTGNTYPTPSIWVTRAALEMAVGKPGAARASLAKALELDPKNRNALFQLADVAIVDGDVIRARELFGRLDSGTPRSDALKLINANVLALESKYDEALAEVDSIKSMSFPVTDLRKRISAIRSTNRPELEKQLEHDAANAVILGRLCILYRKDDPAKALSFCRRASDAEPSNVNHAVGFGAALVQAKQFDAAVALLSKIIAVYPDNSTAHANLATALFQLKRYPEAIVQFNWLASAQPRSAGAYLFLGIIHDEMTEYMDAAANYQQYLRLADPVDNKLDIEKVTLRMPAVQKLIKEGKGKKR